MLNIPPIQPQTYRPTPGSQAIKTKPAQLSLMQMHDFHGQNIRMERAITVSRLFDNDHLFSNNDFFDKSLPVDKVKVSSGDIFLGEEKKEVSVANKFLNMVGVVANSIGNHECDMNIRDFKEIVSDRKYKFLGANMHPDKNSDINQILSTSFIQEINGNQYGFIGLVPPDMAIHLKRPEEVDEYHISDIEQTVKDLQNEVDKLKAQGVNKIILLSHLGLRNEKLMAEKVSGVDVILGAHTHNFLSGVKEGENLIYAPNGEPVFLAQVGRDGEHIGFPNIKFDELGRITSIQYNIIKTDNYNRSLVARDQFEKILGKPDVVGVLSSVEAPPADIYAYENPHCDYIVDALRSELGVDIALMNSSNIRGLFPQGKVDTRDLALISPFGNKVTIINISEEELVNRLKSIVSRSMKSRSHRPGIFQVSGLKYTYSKSSGELKQLLFVDKSGKEIPIDINNPRKNKLYTLVSDDYCINAEDGGLNLKHRYKEALKIYDSDKDKFVESYMKKLSKPDIIKSDGRIKVVD